MLQIHKHEKSGKYFISGDSSFEELIPEGFNNELSWSEGFERVYEGHCTFIYQEFSGNVIFHDCQRGIKNWQNFPELHRVKVFACCERDAHGNDYSHYKEELGLL